MAVWKVDPMSTATISWRHNYGYEECSLPADVILHHLLPSLPLILRCFRIRGEGNYDELLGRAESTVG